MMKTLNINRLTRRSVVTGMLAAAAMPVWAQTIPTNPDVVIIGAGAAGLAAARTLIGQGKSVIIIEAANRIGGRAYTESETFGVPYDHGCFNVMGPKSFDLLNKAEEWGYELKNAKGHGEAVYVGSDKASRAQIQKYWATWDKMENALTKAGKAGLDISAKEAMPDSFYVSEWAGLCQTWTGPMDFAVDFDDMNVLDWYNYGAVDTSKWIKEGYGTLVSQMGEGLPVKLNTPATRVDWSGDGVTVETPAGTIRAKACIITVSPGVLAAGAIKFIPELPDWKQSAIGNLPMGLLAKVALRFDGDRLGFRENKWVSNRVANEMGAEACFFLPWHLGGDHMIGFVGGQFGWELSAAGAEAAVDFALSKVVKMAGSDARKHFVKGHLTGWAENTLTMGAYASAIPGQYQARADMRKSVGDRVFFAGEATSEEYIMLCSGAYMSGERVANDVATVIG